MAKHPHLSESTAFAGSSPAAQHIRDQIERLAQTTSSIVLLGEPGVGKRFVARQIHARSRHQKGGSFVELLPDTSELELKAILFKEGRDRAEGVIRKPIPRIDARSTLFVRNVHEFSFINQTRLARFFIQNDGVEEDRATVRVILASSVAWSELVSQKMVVASIDHQTQKFAVLALPPLRERKEDIVELATEFLRRMGKGRRRDQLVEPAVLDKLKDHIWSDNVRELELLIQEAVHISPSGKLILPGTFFDEVEKLKETIEAIRFGKQCSLEEAVGTLEAALIQRALRRSGFDRQKASRLLGMNEKNLLYRIKKHNVWTGVNGRKK